MAWWDNILDWWDGEDPSALPVDNEAQRAAQQAARWRQAAAPTTTATKPTAGTDPLLTALAQWQGSSAPTVGNPPLKPMVGPLRPGETRPMVPAVGPPIAPPAPPVDPWAQALNAWREGPPKPTAYDPLSSAYPNQNKPLVAPVLAVKLPGSTLDYAVDGRPNTGPAAIQASGIAGDQTTRIGVPKPHAYGGPADEAYYTQNEPQKWGAQSLTPANNAVGTALDAPLSQTLGAAGSAVGDWLGNAYQSVIGGGQGHPAPTTNADPSAFNPLSENNQWLDSLLSGVGSTAAGERFLTDVGQRHEEEAKKRGYGWGDWASELGSNLSGIASSGWNAMTENNKLIRQVLSGEKTWDEAWKDYHLGETMAGLQMAGGILGSMMDITDPTNALKEGALDVASGLQAAQDYVNTRTYDGKPLGAYWSTLFTAAKDAAVATGEDIMSGKANGVPWQWAALAHYIDSSSKRLEEYQAALTPTAEQMKRLTPDELKKQQDRANLNWATPESVANTFDALVDQDSTAASYESKAQQAMQAAQRAQTDEERDGYLIAAADYGAKAYDLKNKHPQAIVNENTNIAAQMLFEILQPDITDIAGELFALAELTPAARRLTSATEEVMQPTARVVEELKPLTQAAATAATSGYNPRNLLNFGSWWTTGAARSERAAGNLHTFVTGLLADVDTAGDAKILLNQLAQDPTKLFTGMDAALFQSEGLLARADEKGLVRFGGQNLNNSKEALTIYQKNAGEILNSLESLNGGPIYNKLDFANEFKDAMEQAGYRYYNVATSFGDAPIGTTSARVKQIEGNQVVIEYLDGKEVVKTSEPMEAAAGRALANDFTKQAQAGRLAQRSVPGVIADSLRKVVSPFYIYTSPGTWATNIIANAAVALGDGSLAGGRLADMKGWVSKLWGVDPTVRGLEGVETAANVAGQTLGGPLAPIKRAYSAIEENFGTRVFGKSAKRALQTIGPEALGQGLEPIFNILGITDEAAKRTITSQLFETGMSGGNIGQEFSNILAGKSKLFSVSSVNPAWLDAIPAEKLEGFHEILRTAPNTETAQILLQKWHDDTIAYYDNLIQEAPVVPQQHVWMKQEVTQDMADLAQTGKQAERAGVNPAEIKAWKESTATAMNEVERKMQTLTQIVADASDPKARYALYNVWGQIHEMTTGVRQELGEFAEKIYGLPAEQRAGAWQEYWQKARQVWDNRNAKANEILETATSAMNAGEDFTPRFDYWSTLERQASVNEQKLWDTLRLEPQSGAYDSRLKQVVDAGRQLADKGVARAYAAARRFPEIDVMSYLVSAEKNAQMAGAQARAYLDRVLENTIKSGKWEDYYSIRNETWRQLRQHEQQVWQIAERNIVRDGIATEATTGLKFDSGFDGVVELVSPESVPTTRTSRLGQEKTVEAKYWLVKREDGTITRVPDNMVPADLKAKYNGITPDEVELQVQSELDNIASANPYAEDAERLLSGDKKLQQQVQRDLNLGASGTVPDLDKAADETIRNTRKAGAVQNPEMALAAQHARESLQNLYNYVQDHLDEILRPKGAIGEGQSLAAIDAFRREVLPIWDNVKATAAKYGDDMRSFSLVDFSNKTRLDEVLGLYAPYAFWYTRTIKNSAERALFEPHIWRRVMQAEKYIADMNTQRGDPKRFEGSIPFPLPNGDVRYLHISPSKYWSAFGLFTHNDYANPESANNAYSYGVESAQAMGFNGYFFWDIANQAAQNAKAGKPLMTDIYPTSYIPQGKLAGWGAAWMFGPNIPQGIRPGYYEYNVGRELTTMVSEGSITAAQAQYAQDILRQMRTGEVTLPEVAAHQEELQAILKQATERAAKKELMAAGSSLLTGIGARTLDADEKTALQAQQLYANRQYDPVNNPYGGETAQSATFQQYPELGPKFSQGAIYDSDKPRPGASASKAEKIQETKDTRDALYTAGDTAVDNLLKQNPKATKKEINEARNAGVLAAAQKLVDPAQLDAYLGTLDSPYYGDVVKFVTDSIEKKYPSADLVEASNKPKDYNPLEQKANFQEATLKQAQQMFPYPTWPGDNATPAQKKAYMDAKSAVDKQRQDWTMQQLTTGGQQLMPNWMKGSTALDAPALAATPEEAKALMEEDKYKYKTEAEKERLKEIDAEGPGGGKYAAARANVASRFSKEDLAVWEGYYALPKGEAREQYKRDNPGFRLINLYAYNRDEVEAAFTEVGIDGGLAWSRIPAYADTPEAKAARAKYFDENPKAFLFHSWLRGRPTAENEGDGDPEGKPNYNFGADYATAKEMFGENIWEIVGQYQRGWNKAQKRAWFEAHPEYKQWSYWWYGNLPKKEGTGTGGGYGRSGGGGGGGYGGGYQQQKRPLSVRIQDVYGQQMAGGLAEPPRVAGYQQSHLDTDWLRSGQELRPSKPREWSAEWIRALRK